MIKYHGIKVDHHNFELYLQEIIFLLDNDKKLELGNVKKNLESESILAYISTEFPDLKPFSFFTNDDTEYVFNHLFTEIYNDNDYLSEKKMGINKNGICFLISLGVSGLLNWEMYEKRTQEVIDQ